MPPPIVSVLLVEDNPSDARIAELALTAEHGFSVTPADCLSGALDHLASGHYDAVLLDLSLPDSSGLETLMELRKHDPDVPVVVMTGLNDENAAVRSLNEGAQDYLVKGDEILAVLRRSIINAVERQKMTRENKHLLSKLKEAKKSLEDRNGRLAEMCETAHEFVDDVSHEFRTPLTVIKEYASIMHDGLTGEVNQEQRDYLEIIGARADDLSRMVDDMLDASRLEAGLLSMARRVCDVKEIVDHVLPTLRRNAATRRVVLDTKEIGSLPYVYCDAEKTGRVIINLVINALKFSPDGKSVRLGARHDSVSGQIVVTVTDEGPGIEPERLSEIFDRFRCDASVGQGSTKGFGLGLNIARDLVHLNLGDISVESEGGRGSTFWFTIPTADSGRLIDRYLDRVGSFRSGVDYVSLVRVDVDGTCDESAIAGVNQLIQHEIRRSDLTFRSSPHGWWLVLAANGRELHSMLSRIRQARDETNRHRPSGPLPPLEISNRGSWHVADQRDEFIEQFTEAIAAAMEPVLG